MKYFYHDFVTKKLRYTCATFTGWTERTGMLHVHYAIFARQRDFLFIPEYCLTAESRAALPKIPEISEEVHV